jgi:hypothetical protein
MHHETQRYDMSSIFANFQEATALSTEDVGRLFQVLLLIDETLAVAVWHMEKLF